MDLFVILFVAHCNVKPKPKMRELGLQNQCVAKLPGKCTEIASTEKDKTKNDNDNDFITIE